MYSTCLYCHRSLGKNEAIEHLPIGKRLAFDSAKGRLWVVCPHCERWNLTPIEERWEAVEESERLFREQRLRAQTDNIGLVHLREGTDLIRIGRPLRPEFAAWRYGRVFRGRLQKRAMVLGGAAAAVTAGGMFVAGSSISATAAPLILMGGAGLWFPFVQTAFLLRKNLTHTKIIGENGKLLRVTRANLDHTRIEPGDGPLRLHLRHTYGRQELTGDRAARALTTLLTRVNRGGGSSSTVKNAAAFIADAGDPRRAIATIAEEAKRRTGNFEERAADIARGVHSRSLTEAIALQSQRREFPSTGPNRGALPRLPAPLRLALEMSLNENAEQHALNEELATLERDWREAEEIAAIADNLL